MLAMVFALEMLLLGSPLLSLLDESSTGPHISLSCPLIYQLMHQDSPLVTRGILSDATDGVEFMTPRCDPADDIFERNKSDADVTPRCDPADDNG